MKTNSGERLQAQNAVISGAALIGIGAYILGGILGRSADQDEKDSKVVQKNILGRESKANPLEALIGQALAKGFIFGFLFSGVIELGEAALGEDTGYSFWGTYGLSGLFIALGYVSMNTHRFKKQ